MRRIVIILSCVLIIGFTFVWLLESRSTAQNQIPDQSINDFGFTPLVLLYEAGSSFTTEYSAPGIDPNGNLIVHEVGTGTGGGKYLLSVSQSGSLNWRTDRYTTNTQTYGLFSPVILNGEIFMGHGVNAFGSNLIPSLYSWNLDGTPRPGFPVRLAPTESFDWHFSKLIPDPSGEALYASTYYQVAATIVRLYRIETDGDIAWLRERSNASRHFFFGPGNDLYHWTLDSHERTTRVSRLTGEVVCSENIDHDAHMSAGDSLGLFGLHYIDGLYGFLGDCSSQRILTPQGRNRQLLHAQSGRTYVRDMPDGSSPDQAQLFATDPNGQVLWVLASVRPEPSASQQRFIEKDGIIYFKAEDRADNFRKKLFAVKISDGEILGNIPIDFAFWSYTVADGGLVYVTTDNKIYRTQGPTLNTTPTPTPTPSPACSSVPSIIPTADAFLIPRDGASGATGPGENLPIEEKTPVILIHGIHGERDENKYFTHLIGYLNNTPEYHARFKTYSFRYKSDVYTTKEIGKALRDRIDATAEFAGKEIIIIAHSMGGIVARHFMLQASANGPTAGACSGARVEKLITLATPHHGTYGANKKSRGDRFPFGLRSLANGLFSTTDEIYWTGFNGCAVCAYDPQMLNRRTLLWDNYNGMLAQYANEDPNDMPRQLTYPGISNFYHDKIIAYSGDISPQDPNWLELGRMLTPAGVLNSFTGDLEDKGLAVGAYLIDSVYLRRFPLVIIPSARNDGLVPLNSARFDSESLMGQVHCPGYNHRKIRDGGVTLCDDGKKLFESIGFQILNTPFAAPALLAGPLRTGFGNQTYGPGRGTPSARVNVELSNLGDVAVQVTSLSIAGSNADQFEIIDAPPLPFVIEPSQRVYVTVAFTPTSPGPKTAELRATNSSSNTTVIVQLNATGLPTACELNVPTSSQFMPTNGGNGEVLIGNISCPWTASTSDEWIHPSILNDRIAFTVDANTGEEIRHGSITISVYGRSYVYNISQDATNASCWLSLSSGEAVMPTAGGTATFALTSPSTCSWTLSSNAAWLTPTAGSTQGSGAVSFTARKNFGFPRSAVITIQGQQSSAEFTVHQLQGRHVQFDYDPAGKAVFSLFTPSSDVWYLQTSGPELQLFQQ